MRLVRRKQQIVGLELAFNEPLESNEAGKKENYSIFNLKGTRPNRPVPISSATYDPATNIVLLVTTKLLKLAKPLQVSANNAITDLAGNPLGGGPGDPGEEYVARLSESFSVAFTELDGDRATFTLSGGGYLRLVERTDGSERTLHLVGDVSGSSTLSGSVKKRKTGASDGRASLTGLTVVPGRQFRSTLANPPFRIGPLTQTAIDDLLVASGGSLSGVLFSA
jgi:hypothetical protein